MTPARLIALTAVTYGAAIGAFALDRPGLAIALAVAAGFGVIAALLFLLDRSPTR